MKYFCVGIKGSGMSTLAQILSDLGHTVAGYDDNKNHTFTEEGLIKRNIPIYYEQTHPIDKEMIVTYSKAFSLNHPELVFLKNAGLEFVEYNELLGMLTREFETIGISGTHGKTTTSTMITDILKDKGVNYFIGDGSGYAKRDNKLFVIESCEFKRHFLSYSPYLAVVTNIELEHTECYSGIEDIIETFNKFVNKAKIVVACGDDINVCKLKTNNKVYHYGFKTNNDIYATNIIMNEAGSDFDVFYNKNFLGHFHMPLVGKHMILNALCSILVGILYNVNLLTIKDALSNFTTPKRRFKETKVGDNIIIDDYAHHPTEILKTIEAARIKYPTKKIVAIFKPNTYSRTLALKDDFIKVLSMADETYITPIDCNREKQSDYPNISSDDLVSKIPNGHLLAKDDITPLTKYHDTVLVFMSCANIYTLEDKYKETICK